MKRLTAIAAIALVGTPVLAADLNKPVYKAPPPAPAPVYSWTGWYVGGNVGYGWGQNQSVAFSDVPGPLVSAVGIPASISFNTSGALGGVQLGYNWQFNQTWLAGFETDFNFADIDGNGASNNLSALPFCPGNTPLCPLVATANERLEWFGTARARLGYLPANNLLLYGTGGFAYGKLNQSVQYNNVSASLILGNDGNCPAASTCFSGASNRIATGWTAGAGFEYALLNNWTFKAEYLYVDLGSNTFNEGVLFPATAGGTGLQTASLTAHYNDFAFHVVRGGFNYKF